MRQTCSQTLATFRHTAFVATSVALAAALVACGGGGDGGADTATTTSTPNTGMSNEQKMQVLQLVSANIDATEDGFRPLTVTDDDDRVLPVATVCPNGGSFGLRSGGVTVAQGGIANQSPLATSFSQCRDSDGTLNGAISLDIRPGLLQATFTNFQESDTSARSRTSNGVFVYTYTPATVSNNISTQTFNIAPRAGMTLSDVSSGLTSTFVSGSLQETFRRNASTAATLAKTLSVLSVTLSSGGQTYVVNGSMTRDLVSPAGNNGTLEVTTAGGTRVGRLRITASSVQLETAI